MNDLELDSVVSIWNRTRNAKNDRSARRVKISTNNNDNKISKETAIYKELKSEPQQTKLKINGSWCLLRLVLSFGANVMKCKLPIPYLSVQCV